MLNSLIYEMPDLFFCFIPQIVFLRGIIFSKFAKKCKHLALLARCMSACARASGWASERACKRGCDKALFFIAFRKRTWLKKRYGHYLTNEWTYERTSGRTNWQTNKHTIKVMNKQTNERTNEQTSEPDKSASKSIIYHSFFLLKS